MKTLELYEIFESANKSENPGAVLREHNSVGLRDLLRLNFDKTLEVLLPAGSPPFTSMVSEEKRSPTSLRRELKHLGYFVKGGPGTNLKSWKRENMFIKILEGVHPGDAKLMIAVKDRKLESLYPNITEELVRELFPNLILSKPGAPEPKAEKVPEPVKDPEPTVQSEDSTTIDLEVEVVPEVVPEVAVKKTAKRRGRPRKNT